MLKELRPALALLVLFTLLTGVVYPFVTTGIASVLFPYQARGSLIERDGKVIGSAADRAEFHRSAILPRPPVGDSRRRPG